MWCKLGKELSNLLHLDHFLLRGTSFDAFVADWILSRNSLERETFHDIDWVKDLKVRDLVEPIVSDTDLWREF